MINNRNLYFFLVFGYLLISSNPGGIICRPRTLKYAPHKSTSKYLRSFERDIFGIKYYCVFKTAIIFSHIQRWKPGLRRPKHRQEFLHFFAIQFTYVQSWTWGEELIGKAGRNKAGNSRSYREGALYLDGIKVWGFTAALFWGITG